VATLQRALNAMGRALVVQVVKQKSSVDETLLLRRATPAERLDTFEQFYSSAREFALEIRDARV
jgi:hypothetical protein